MTLNPTPPWSLDTSASSLFAEYTKLMSGAEDEDISISDSSSLESGEMTPGLNTEDKQHIALQSYLSSLPYKCETAEQMQTTLENIVGKIIVCAKSRNWLVLTTWDSVLQCWMLLRYPMKKTTRAKLVKVYYELCCLPGIEARIIRNWADMISRLLTNKSGHKRKLYPSDLELPWRPLWRVLQRELRPKARLQDDTRNLHNILLFIAEECSIYFPPTEIPHMLNQFLPMVTKTMVWTMVPILTSFLPAAHSHLYMPTLMRLWEAFNSSIIDERMLDICGALSEVHTSGIDDYVDIVPERVGDWKDVGMWTDVEWAMLMRKALSSMNVPVGAVRGASTTASHADVGGEGQTLRFTKTINRQTALAKIMIYSMSLDGPVRAEDASIKDTSEHLGFVGGSKALDSLDKLITSCEPHFHPSNSGHWTISLTNFIENLGSQFCKRWKEEQLRSCKTPVVRRLTVEMRRAFVKILHTPALMAMFAKDPLSATYAQNTLRSLAVLEPDLIMPEIVDRAYSDLEGVNEAHRTIAVMTTLSNVALPLVSEQRWLGGQKHIVPLLNLCIPGIDLNDPMKTICASIFILSVTQHIKIADISKSGSYASSRSDDAMPVDHDFPPEWNERTVVVLSRDEERYLARESTSGFADWVTSLFRRVLSCYEALPEEGGKRNTTGGKIEETVLRTLKSMLDVVCLQLSDPLFDLVLKLVYDYATTNAKANAVRAMGQLISCLARVQPEKVIVKFLPFCMAQIKEELKHGASSIRTTSSHAAVPSDTTLHWNLSILRGCLGYGGPALLKHKEEIVELIQLLVDKTKSERGYNGSGRLIQRILACLACVYTVNARSVNSDKWNNDEFNRNCNIYWGRLFDPQEVEVEWHVPSGEEIDFVHEILDKVGAPLLDKLEQLLENIGSWDSIARNDFCRFTLLLRNIWSGLSQFIIEGPKEVKNPCLLEDIELAELLATPLHPEAGFVLQDLKDPRHQRALAHRTRFGHIIHRAALALRHNHGGEDHIDATLAVSKAIDVYLLEYALTRSDFDSLQSSYAMNRDMNRMWPKQRENSRQVLVKRAATYHGGRMYLHSLYRRRSELDDLLLSDIIESSLSPYTRVRRHSQAVYHNVTGYYLRSARASIHTLLSALAKGTDPDRMKGALYVLGNKGTAAYALADTGYFATYLRMVLECQHQEKPSIQSLVSSVAKDAAGIIVEEMIHTEAYSDPADRLDAAIDDLLQEFSSSLINQDILQEAIIKGKARGAAKIAHYDEAVSSILDIACKPTTHWRYVQIATRFLYVLLRRDSVPTPKLAKFLAEQSISPHHSIRNYAQKAIVKLISHIKWRTYAKSSEELWRNEWRASLHIEVPINAPTALLSELATGNQSDRTWLVDKLETGFLVWAPSIKAYRRVDQDSAALVWEDVSHSTFGAIQEVVGTPAYFEQLLSVFGQESSKNPTTVNPRSENISFIASLVKILGPGLKDIILNAIEPMLTDGDRYKQRAGAELFAGLHRGAKNWPQQHLDTLWNWSLSHLEGVYTQIKPDTQAIWEYTISIILKGRDSQRIKPLIDFILGLRLEFQGDSAFEMTKALSWFKVLVIRSWSYIAPLADRYMNLFLANANTGYAEIRNLIAYTMEAIVSSQWQPGYRTTEECIVACQESPDPLFIRKAKHLPQVAELAARLPLWRQERFPPPRVSQSQYDKVGLTLLQWVWIFAYQPESALIFPYTLVLIPDVLRMSELNDSSELQTYSSSVLYVLSAVTFPQDYIEVVAENFLSAIKSSESWRIRLHALPTLSVFFYRNLMSVSADTVTRMMDVLLECLSDENVEVREMASKMLSGVVRCSQRQSIIPLKDRFVKLARETKLPPRKSTDYAPALRTLHSAILGLCALIESFPYSIELWMPPLTHILAEHATDPIPISTTIRKCASEFKKTHQETWQKDQLAFNEDQLQSLSTMLVGTSYYA